ncbi:MAG: Lrp/AsnC family transcriptional regulator [Nitrosopumilaceae archaeon]|nr:Lrp/AsnC family transcriptional regulator [Nitrosopumilaceae archaeon]
MSGAFVLLTCEEQKQDIKDQIKEIQGIKSVKNVHGAYDCLAETKEMNSEDIKKLVKYNIRPIEGVRATLILKKFDTK